MVQLRTAVLLYGITIFAIVWMSTEGNIQKDCPSQCECSLTTTPHILCRERFTLPRLIPQEALSLHCFNCSIVRMTAKTFEKYTHLRQLNLTGSSQPMLDVNAVYFLRSVPELVLVGYTVSPSDLLLIVGPGHTVVLQNITLTPLTSYMDPVAINV